MTKKRISNLSCDETEFNKVKITYETTLKSSGYQATLKFERRSQNTRRNQNRKVIWFNPPFSLNVKANKYTKNSLNSFVNISLQIIALENIQSKHNKD